MSGISGVGSTGGLPPQEPTMPTTDPDESSAVNFFQDQYANQVAGIASEQALQGSD